MELDGTHTFKFCTLPGIVLLKLLAWADRPEVRRDNIKDIADILIHYFQMQHEDIYENHLDLFEGADLDLSHIAARVLGREMNKISRPNQKLFNRIDEILEENTRDAVKSKIAIILRGYFDNTLEENVELLKQLKLGLTE